MASTKNSTLLDRPIAQSLLVLALPSVVAMLSRMAVSVAEVWCVGILGTGQLAGLALVFPLYMLKKVIMRRINACSKMDDATSLVAVRFRNITIK